MRGRATPAAGNDGAGPRDGGAEARDESKEAGRVLDILSSPSKTSLRWAGRIRVFPDKMTVKHLPDPPAVAHSPTSANPVSGCQWSLAITDILYFEVVVLSDLGAVAIGVAQKTVPLRSHTGSEGGNNKAFGYVSRDGGIFTGNTRVLENVFRFSTGDVVGCGYRGERGEVYFTRNGQHLKTLNAVTRSLAEGLVPTVTLEGEGTVVRFNLVGPFEYNVHTMAPNDSSNGSRRNLMTPAGAGRGTLRPGTVSKKRAEDELGPYLRCRSQKRVKLLRDKVTFSAIPDGRRSEYVLVFGSRPVPRLSSKDGAGATGSMGRAFYFEVTLASTAQLPHADHPDSLQGADIYVGLAEKTLVGLPGIEDTRSIAVWGASGALLGDDERLLRESVDPQLDPEVLGEEGGVLCLTAGDVLGCGVELESGRAFFTQNGLFAGWAGGSVGGKEDPWRMPYEAELRLYPVVALKAAGDLVTLNLDHQGTPLRPFVYDLEYLPRLPYPPGPGATVLGGTAVGADDAGGGGWEETGGRRWEEMVRLEEGGAGAVEGGGTLGVPSAARPRPLPHHPLGETEGLAWALEEARASASPSHRTHHHQQEHAHPTTPPERGGRAGVTTLHVEGEGEGEREREREQLPANPPATPASEVLGPQKWKPGRQLGQGAFGRVFEALNQDTGEFMAVKEVRLYGTPLQVRQRVSALEREISIMGRLRHANIVKYLGTRRDAHKLFIFMEVAPKGSVAAIISAYGPLSEEVGRSYTRQCLLGLEYLHNQLQPVIHRDIKGANLLLWDNGVAKLGDFGASKQLNQLSTLSNENKSLIGTPFWMAPEVIRESGHGRKADIWSVGCTLIEMLRGRPPWSELENPLTALFQIASTDKLPIMPSGVSAGCLEFLHVTLERDPVLRPSAEELLTHHWISSSPKT